MKWTPVLLFLVLCTCCDSISATDQSAHAAGSAVPVLVYHRFAPEVTDSMTMTIDTFAWQLRYLREHGYTVIRAHELVDYLRGTGAAPQPKSVVITADDGHRSVYSDMLPLVRHFGIHVTLFIYPSAISNATYALTWSQLAELVHTGMFDVQSHTYWHPNFRKEARRLTPPQYSEFVSMQLLRSRQTLENRLAIHVDLLAWPFGIFDEDLKARARVSGYVAAFSIEDHPVRGDDSLMALPRHLMTNADRGAAFAQLLGER
jgi:Polysaccharide deacetylase